MNADELVALNEEIAAMARAGLPLDQGLAALARDMGRGRLRNVTTALADDLRAGRTLPEALQRQGDRVPPYYASLVSAGIRTGRVGEVLATLTGYARAVANVRAIVLGSLFYPAIVLLFALAVFWLMTVFILPVFATIFDDFRLQLPGITVFLIGIGRHPLERFVFPVLAVVLGLLLFRLLLRSTAAGRSLWARLVYSIPVVGTLLRSARLAAFTELLAILVDQGLPLPEAFLLAGGASSDPLTRDSARHVQQELSHGRPLGEVLRGRGLVPDWVAWMTGLGERRSTLGPALHQIAEMYRRQVDMRAALLRNVLPPFLIIATSAVFIGFFVLALMLPMIRLLEGLSGGF